MGAESLLTLVSRALSRVSFKHGVDLSTIEIQTACLAREAPYPFGGALLN